MFRKKIIIPCFVVFACWIISVATSSFKAPDYSSIPPQGYTGATGVYCNNCHSGNTFNATGGSVSVSGLPTGTYTAGQTYNFSLIITHSAANRLRWGFSIKAVNEAGVSVGSFSSNNNKAAVNGGELSHFNAVSTVASATYTYSNLSWTAPISTTGNNQTIRFYYAGNAANGSFSSGDFIYAGSLTVTAAPPPCTTNNWIGTVSTAWENPGNWSCGVVPDSTMNVTVQSPAPNYPVVNSIAYCKSITTSQGVQVIVSSGKNLNVTGRQ